MENRMVNRLGVKLYCKKCARGWLYLGKSIDRTCCPKCGATIRLSLTDDEIIKILTTRKEESKRGK